MEKKRLPYLFKSDYKRPKFSFHGGGGEGGFNPQAFALSRKRTISILGCISEQVITFSAVIFEMTIIIKLNISALSRKFQNNIHMKHCIVRS